MEQKEPLKFLEIYYSQQIKQHFIIDYIDKELNNIDWDNNDNFLSHPVISFIYHRKVRVAAHILKKMKNKNIECYLTNLSGTGNGLFLVDNLGNLELLIEVGLDPYHINNKQNNLMHHFAQLLKAKPYHKGYHQCLLFIVEKYPTLSIELNCKNETPFDILSTIPFDNKKTNIYAELKTLYEKNILNTHYKEGKNKSFKI